MFIFNNEMLEYLISKFEARFAKPADLDTKVNKVDGKVLVSNDFTNEDIALLEKGFDDVTISTENKITTLTFYSGETQLKQLFYECESGSSAIIISSLKNESIVGLNESLIIPYAFISKNIGGGTLYAKITNENGATTNKTKTLSAQGSGTFDFGVLLQGTNTLELYAVDSKGEQSAVISLVIYCLSEEDMTIINIAVTDAENIQLLSNNNQILGDGLIDWGDGTSQTISDVSQAKHTYSQGGIYKIKGRFTFGDGAVQPDFMKNNLRKIVQFSNLKNPTSLASAFEDCANLSSINFKGISTVNTTSMASMFKGCSRLTSIVCDNIDTSNVTDMSSLFEGCTLLTNVNSMLKKFNTSKVTNMASMFNGCENLPSIDLSILNTSKVTNMQNLCKNCSSVTSVLFTADNANYIDTSKVTDMSSLFEGCVFLEGIDIKINTAAVTNMANMFNGCSKLASINLESFNTSKVTNMANMFKDCVALSNLNIDNFATSNVTDMQGMFENCSVLNPIGMSHFATSSVKYFNNMFKGCSSITNLNLNHFVTNNALDMKYMFDNCTNLTTLNISQFVTDKVIDMQYMFNECHALTNLSLPTTMNTAQVTSMRSMFNNCSNLTTLNLNTFNTLKVTNMRRMFNNCSNLTTLNVSSFSVPLCTDMYHMFANCKKVTTLDVSNFNAQSVLNMNSMFINCEKLTALNTSSFNTQDVRDMSRMFDNCLSLKGELDLSNINCFRIQDEKMILDPDDQTEMILFGGFGYKENDEFYKFIYAPLLTSFKAPKNIKHSMYIYAPLIPKDNIVTLYNNLSEVSGGKKRINTYCNSYGSLTTEEMHIAVEKGWMIGK